MAETVLFFNSLCACHMEGGCLRSQCHLIILKSQPHQFPFSECVCFMTLSYCILYIFFYFPECVCSKRLQPCAFKHTLPDRLVLVKALRGSDLFLGSELKCLGIHSWVHKHDIESHKEGEKAPSFPFRVCPLWPLPATPPPAHKAWDRGIQCTRGRKRMI